MSDTEKPEILEDLIIQGEKDYKTGWTLLPQYIQTLFGAELVKEIVKWEWATNMPHSSAPVTIYFENNCTPLTFDYDIKRKNPISVSFEAVNRFCSPEWVQTYNFEISKDYPLSLVMFFARMAYYVNVGKIDKFLYTPALLEK